MKLFNINFFGCDNYNHNKSIVAEDMEDALLIAREYIETTTGCEHPLTGIESICQQRDFIDKDYIAKRKKITSKK